MNNKKILQPEQVVTVRNSIIFLLFLVFSFCAYGETEKVLNMIRYAQKTLEVSMLLIRK